MSWQAIYRGKITTPDAAIRAIKSGHRVFLTGNASIPKVLLKALVDYAPEIEDVEICHALTLGSSDYVAEGMEDHIRVNTMFIGANVRRAVQEGRADFTPVLLSEFTLLFKQGFLPLDVALVHLSPPDEHGFCSFGVESGLTKTPAESARTIVAEVNQQMPRTLGDTFIHVSKLDFVVPVDYPLMEMPMSEDGSSELSNKIASNIAELIPDGATMQMGIGAIPDAVLNFLYDKKDLGVHTELFSDGVIDLFAAGVITNARKTLHQGKITAGFAIGTRRLYEFIHDNPIIELHRTEYVNDPFVIAQNERQVAINSAIEVDLTGQVCADSIGPRLYSGVGGQLDFVYGAARSKDGVPIIVPMLKTGAGVVTTRNHVRFVVTEHGVADLYGKTIRQRAKALIDVAAPEFRDELRRAANELHYV
jgi:4-hydroxybutyrate CoA-transferase